MPSVLITGANGSLALPAVDYILSQYPSYTLVLTVRNDSDDDKNTAKLKSIVAKFPSVECHIRALDLNKLSDVNTFAESLRADIEEGKIPYLAAIICNAMTWSLLSGQKFSEDGLEQSLQVNHLSQFSLTLRLLDSMDKQNGRIVFLSSDSHRPGRAAFEVYPPIIPDDLEELVKPKPDDKGEKAGRGFYRYGLSKLVIVMTMYELNRRLRAVRRAPSQFSGNLLTVAQSDTLDSVRALAIDPGGLLDSRSLTAEHVPTSWKLIFSVLRLLRPLLVKFMPNMQTSASAAREVVDVAISEKYAGQDGHFVIDHKEDSSPESHDDDTQKKLFEKSLEWAGVRQEDTILPL
jgi:NAD(P)-dependent dehydrogenase (short-subunit alcohol dehydrogenase family)